MISLVAKELRQLIPFALIWLCLLALFYGSELATVRVDEESYFSWCDEYCNVGTNTDIVLFNILLFLIAAYSLFPREFDDSTIDFLRSLPISRSKIFVTKIVAILLLLWFLLFLDKVLQIALLSLNTQSITGRNYWRTDLLFFVRDCLFAFVIVSHGVLLSWFRTAGLLIYCAYLIVLIWLEQIMGASGIYSIFGFYSNEYDGPNLIVDWVTIGFHVLLACGILILGFILWSKTDSRPRAPGSGKLARALPVIFSIFAFILATGYMMGMMQSADTDAADEGIVKRSTDYYSFSYREADSEAMLALEVYADKDYESLHALLDAKSTPIVQADMTSDSEHALGLASWKKIRMVLTTADEVDPLYRRVLSHETAHVFQAVESDRAFGKVSNSVNFFIEGMAQYTSFNIVPDEESRSTNWAIAAVSWQRHNIKFEEMANRQIFASLYDPEMLYGIGDIWVDAMANSCGVDSIGELLRAVGRDGAPPNLSGTRFWRNHLQHIGCELEEVNSQWRKQMQSIVEQRQAGAFPYFENVVIERNESSQQITITADLKPAESGILPEHYYIRIMSEATLASTVNPLLKGKLIREGEVARVEFSVLPRVIDGKQFQFQLGYMPFPDSRNYYEKWRSGAVPQ